MTASAPLSRRLWPAKAGALGAPEAIAGLGGLGILVSSVLIWLHYESDAPLCTGAAGCRTVNTSPYSEVMGVPLAILGLLMYSAILGLSLLARRSYPGGPGLAGPPRNLRFRGVPLRPVALAIFGLALAGLLYSGYLTYLEVNVIHALCPWCLASQGIIAAIFVLSLPMAIKASAHLS